LSLSIRTTWEVRPTGNASNSGGFNPANVNAGTDYNQQDAAQTIRTDLVIGAANTLTSAATPFTAAEIGNLIRILSGTGFTPGFYELVSLAGVTVTLDRSPGTLASSGGTGRVGGALSTPNDTPAIAGGVVWIRAGAGYTTGVQWVLNDGVGDGNFVAYLGYGTTRGDNLPATVTALGVLSPMLTQANQIIVKNLVIDGANLATRGINMGFDCFVQNVHVKRCSLSGMLAQNEGTRIRRCLFTFDGAGAAAGTGLDVGTGCIATECEAHDNKQGFTSSNGTGEFVRCISHDNTGSGFYQAGDDGMRLRNCIGDSNAVDGLQLADASGLMTMEVANCLFTNNTGVGVHSVTTDYSGGQFAQVAAFFQNNAFYNNGNNYSGVPAGADDILLTVDPYTDRAGGDFSLNGTAGGGAALRGAGVPGGFGLLGTSALGSTSYVDVGAVQGLSMAGSGSAFATMVALWREFTGEHDTTVPDDTVVALWIDRGLEALNRRLRYHWTTDSTSVVLVAGTQEYSLPADLIELRWVQWNGRELAKGDIQEWRRNYDEWRNETAGEPTQYAIYGDKLVIRPIPSAEAVAAAPSPVFRYCSKPPAVATSGAEQLNSQNWPIAVAYGAAAYAGSYPDSAAFAARRDSLMKLFEDEVQTIALDYADRALKK
jgi:hypothetical protein